MKKFMIFLLMAFLFLGTSQARSEAPHFIDAHHVLQSWVTPSSSILSLLNVNSSDEVVVEITPSQPMKVALQGEAAYQIYAVSVTGLSAGDIKQYDWYIDFVKVQTTLTPEFKVSNLAAGSHAVSCHVITNANVVYQSPAAEITFAEGIIANIVGPDHACIGDVVTLTAQVENDGIGHTYQWKRDGNYILNETGATYSFQVNEANLPNLNNDNTLVYDFEVEIIREGCEKTVSPVHHFSVSPTPVVNIEAPQYLCEGGIAVLTANAYTSGNEQPYQWEWTNVTTHNTYITYVNNFTVTEEGEYTVKAYYQDFSCDAVSSNSVEVKEADALPEVKKFDITATSNGKVCENATITFTISDENPATLGAPSYSWFVDGQYIETITESIYTTAFPNHGNHKVIVRATYANSVCAVESDTIDIEVYPAPKIAITGENIICEGGQAALTLKFNENADFDVNTLEKVVWEGPGVTATEDQLKINATAGTYVATAYLTASAEGGNAMDYEHNCPATSAPFTVYSLGADLQISASATTICKGESVVLNANADGWIGDVIYDWGSEGTGSTVTVAPEATTTYSVKATVTSTTGSCDKTDAIKINVNTPPTITSVDFERATVCQGEQVTVSATEIAGAIYTWFEDGVQIPGENLASITLTPNAGKHIYAAKAELNGCVSEVVKSSVLTVLDAPQMVITGENIICEGEVAELTTTELDPSKYEYVWTSVNSTTTAVNKTTVTAGTYTVTAQPKEGVAACPSTSAPFTVYSLGADLQVIASATTVCKGESVILNANSDGWIGNVTYAWDNGLGNNPTVTAYPEESTTYTVTATVTSSTSTCTKSASIDVKVLGTPVIDAIRISNGEICEGKQVTLTAVGAETYASYRWFENGIEMEGQNLATITVEPKAGEYSYAVMASNGKCSSSLVNATAKLTVYANPTIAISGDPFLCTKERDEQLHLRANLNDNEERSVSYTYEWRRNNVTVLNQRGARTYTENLKAQDEPYIYTVIATHPTTGCVAKSEEYPVYVGENLKVAVTVDHDLVCNGGEVTATAHLGDYTRHNLTFQWYEIYNGEEHLIPSGTELTYTTRITHNPTQLRVRVFQTTTECEIVGTSDPIVIWEPEVINSVVALNEGKLADNVCEGAQLKVVAKILRDGVELIDPTYTYRWEENGHWMPLINTPEFSKQMYIYDGDPVDYTYTVYINYDVPGCEAVPVASNTVHVKRNPIVTIDGNPNVCYQGPKTEDITLVAWVDGTYDRDAKYQWFESGQARPNTSGYDNKYVENWVPSYLNPYIFTVEVTNGDGCSSISEPFYVNVYDKPVVNITSEADGVCEGGEIELRANLNNYNDTMITYQWYADVVAKTNLLPGATHEIQKFRPSRTTNYIVKVTHLLDFNTQYCVAYDTFNVKYSPVPQIKNVITDFPESNEICEGRQITLTAEVEGGVEGGEIFTWYRNGSIIPNATQISYTETPQAVNDDPTKYVYKVSVRQSASGCESPIYEEIDTLTVNPNPTLVLTTDPIVCVETEDNITLTANVDPKPSTEYTFTWFEDNVKFSETTDNSIKVTKPYRDYAYNFSVELVNEYGCTVNASANVLVNAVPVVNIFASETQICNGGEVTLTAELDDWNADQLVFQWFDGDELIAGATSLTYVAKPEVGSHRYSLTVKQLTSECVAYSDTIDVTVNNDPTIDRLVSDLPESNVICEGRPVTMQAFVAGGVQGGEIFTWYRNGKLIEGATQNIYSETPQAINNDPTTFTYVVSVRQTASGCESSISTDTIKVTVNPNPNLVIEADPIVCNASGNNIKMVAHVDPKPATAYTYTWYEDNAIIAANMTDSILNIHRDYRDYAYNFSVELVNEYGCTVQANTSVLVDSTPTVNIFATETQICQGGEITLRAELNNWNADELEYKWYHNGDIIPGATSLTYTTTPELGENTYEFEVIQWNSRCNATSENPVVVNVVKVPVIAAINDDLNDQYTICDGRRVAMEAVVEGGVQGGEIFTWYRNGQIIEGATQATYTETPHALANDPTTYVYTVSVRQTAAGCESTVSTKNVRVVVNPNPVVTLQYDPIVCKDVEENIILTANVYPETETPYTFVWLEDGAEFKTTTTNTITLHKPYRDYAYNFGVQILSEYGCTVTDEAHILVNDAPIVNVNVTENTICEGGEITLTTNLNDWNADQLTFQWYDNDVLIPGATSLTYTVVPTLGEHNYVVKVKQLTSECEASNVAVKVNVIADPVIANVTVSDYNVCQGAELTITANPENYEPAASDVYTWYKNGIEIPGATNRVIKDAPVTVDNNTQQFIYTAVVTRAISGCTSLPVSANALTVYPNPTVVISGDQHICEGDSVFLMANVDTIGRNVGLLHYTWYESGQIRDNMAYGLGDRQFYAEMWYARTEPYRFTVEVEREGVPAGCNARSAEYLVYVYNRPVVNVTASETEICENGEVTLTAHLNDYNADDMTYQWYTLGTKVDSVEIDMNDDGSYIYSYDTTIVKNFIPGATEATYTTTLAETTTLGVLVFQIPSECQDIDEITITVNPLPVITGITVNEETAVTVCDGAVVNVAATIDPADAEGAVYTWYRNGKLIPGATQSTFTEHVYTNDNVVTDYLYTAIVTLPASGCVSNLSVMSGKVTVKPAPSVVTISGNNVICEGDSSVLTAYADVDGEFIWSTGDKGTSVKVPAGSYFVTLVTPEGCQMTSETFDVKAFGTEILVTADPIAICQGEHTKLSVDANGWQGNITYQWDENANNSTATSVDVTPDVTTTYHVTATVKSTNGSCQITGEVTVVVTPRPEIVKIEANKSEICEGEQITFHASGNGYTYIWRQNGVEIPGENGADLTINFPVHGTYTFDVKAVNDQNCTSEEFSEPVTVNVYAAPVDVVVSGNSVICDGGFTTLFANVTYVDGKTNVETSYAWFKDNVLIADAKDASLVVTEAGSYKVIASVHGCSTESDAVVVRVEQAPKLQLSATDYVICEYGSTVIKAEATGWNNADVTFSWSNGWVGSQYTFVPTKAGEYQFIVTASQATSGCVAVDTINIKVLDAPAAPVVTVDNAIVCDGGQVTLTIDNDYTIYGEPTYTWYKNGVVIPGAKKAVLTESPVTVDNDRTVYEYRAEVSFDLPGCSSVTSEKAIVTVIPTPVVAVTVDGNTTLCDGGSTTLVANVTPAAAIYSYQWYEDNKLMEGETNATLNVTLAARESAYKYHVVVKAAPGCEVSTYDTPVLINVVADPVVTASVDNAIVCAGGKATFTVNVEGGVDNVNGLNAYTYAWFNNLSTDKAISTEASYTTTGTENPDAYAYWVVVTSPYGCQTKSNIVNYTVVPDPTVNITVAQGFPTTICEGGSTTLIANVEGGYGEASYTWYRNGVEIYGYNHPTIEVMNATFNENYQVVVKQTGVDCQATSEYFNVTVIPTYTVAITDVNGGHDFVACQGGTVTLKANVNGVIPGDNVTYQWYYQTTAGTMIINGATQQTYTVSANFDNQYNYFVIATSEISGCTSQADGVTIELVADPTVAIVGEHTVCDGGNLILTAVVDHSVAAIKNAAYTYTWTWTGAANGTAVTAEPTFVPNLDVNMAEGQYNFFVTITRNDNSGCDATSDKNGFAVNVLGTPAVEITANHAYVCEGGKVVLTANVTPAGAYDFKWVVNGKSIATNASSIEYVMNESGLINASVTVQANNGSLNPQFGSCQTTATLAVPVKVVADPVVTIAADYTSVCVGSRVQLTSNIKQDANISAKYNYEWTVDGVAMSANTPNRTIDLTAPGTYTYQLRVVPVDASADLDCGSAWSNTVTIQVAEQPQISLVSNDGLAICVGGDITLTATVDNFSEVIDNVLNSDVYGPMTFNWTSTNKTAIHEGIMIGKDQYTDTLNKVGNYEYQVVVIPSNPTCQSAASNKVNVNVVNDPSWTAVQVYYPDVCIGQPVILKADIQGGVADYSGSTNGYIQWTVTYNGVTSNVSGGFGGDSYDLPSAPGDYIYTPTFVGNIGSGCQLSNTASVQQPVVVHALPTARFISGDGTTICANISDASAELIIKFTGTAPFTFQLQDLTTGVILPAQVSGTDTYVFYVSPEVTTQYRIFSVSDAYCENGQLDTGAVATIYVNDFRFDETMFVSGCDDNGMVTIHFTMVSGQPYSQFFVKYDNFDTVYTGNINNGTATFPAPAEPGDYHAVFTVDGCNFDIIVRVLIGEDAFTDGTHPFMDQRWNDVVVINNNPETNGGHHFVGFQWYKNGVAIPGATYSNYQEKGGLNGFYSIEVIEKDENGKMVTYVTCPKYFASSSSIKVYPVPANVQQEITIELDLTSEELEGAILDVYDVTGSLVSHVSNLTPITKISGFTAQGTYFGRILTGTNEIKTVKFVIVK